ncbi:MAG: ribosome biogenesis GTP-binding protein YihA/YsxC [Candidatus Moranbacteria bacterium]|jgi:GTP-binding protein|nr:ribosome biogenesis GTP-binding protein YihA/YsxC [Candidatus Moranbacteria bacterium]MDD5652330.1 ribosome biogenesis GTP-binding protein YihA/YsxC [Candidatus Moranbacteria bacterium]MDX9855545.1 ribosome biogenesis GTP-binding protein YihA/YsxC [Candidatus Moranbacteria bacterium]
MFIKSAEFVKGITGTNEILLDGRPQIAFVGRSNVGKSSLINSLVGRKDLARSSSKPGKTQEVNFFLINNGYYFVDLPGYGFAKVSPKRKEKIRKMIVWYLSYAESRPKKVVLVVDSKAGAKKFDVDMKDLLREENLDFFVVANKIDKLRKNEEKTKIKEIMGKLGMDDSSIVSFSSKTLKNREKIIKKIFD